MFAVSAELPRRGGTWKPTVGAGSSKADSSDAASKSLEAATNAGMRVFNRIVRNPMGLELAKQTNVMDSISSTLENAPPDSKLSQVPSPPCHLVIMSLCHRIIAPLHDRSVVSSCHRAIVPSCHCVIT